MSRLFVGNFDFEHELAGVHRPAAARLSKDLSACWLAVATEEDAVLGFEDVDADFENELRKLGRAMPRCSASRGDELVPWGWTNSMRTLADELGCKYTAPSQGAVRNVNSRRFSHDCEVRFERGLSRAAMVRSVAEFRSATDELDAWVAKAEFSMSSRERMLGSGAANDAQLGWVTKRIAETGVVFVEPWLAIEAEVGLQFDVQPHQLRYLGASGLLTTERGQFAGSFVAKDLLAGWPDTSDIAPFLALRARAENYFGPFGFDAARYKVSADTFERPLQDVNARYTMGQFALGYGSQFSDDCVAWLFVSWCERGTAADFVRAAAEVVGNDVRLFRTSPFRIGSHTVRLGTLLITGDDTSDVLRSAAAVVALTGRALRVPTL